MNGNLIDRAAGIYIFTNRTNGKRYIGESLNLKERLRKYHYQYISRPIENAIKKYGIENFDIEIYYFPFFNKKDLCDLEEILIKRFNCLAPNGYNVLPKANGLNEGPPLKPVAQICAETGNVLNIFDSISIASNKTGLHISRISDVCNGKKHTTGNFLWIFIDNLTDEEITRRKELKYKKQKDFKLQTANRRLNKLNEFDIKLQNKQIIQLDCKTGETISIFSSLKEASENTQIGFRGISLCINQQAKTAGGFIWIRFSELNDIEISKRLLKVKRKLNNKV